MARQCGVVVKDQISSRIEPQRWQAFGFYLLVLPDLCKRGVGFFGVVRLWYETGKAQNRRAVGSVPDACKGQRAMQGSLYAVKLEG